MIVPTRIVLLVLVLVGCSGSVRTPQPPPAAPRLPAPPAPLLPIPSERQMAWQERELIAFVHFGVNTFTDREWGDGSESPALLAPTALDARQWTRVLADAGVKMVILTAKHHDGFALWPSKLTTHSVASSPFRDGRGDVVGELAEACRADGLAMGLYLSPWDRHEPRYGTAEYNDFYVAQLTELLTRYGPVHEVWFDGANGEGPNGKRQEYDFARFWETVRRLQPQAVLFSDAGPDVRWIGNERGFADEVNWSTLDRSRMVIGKKNAGQTTGHEGGPDWVPAEVDVSIRPGWFYHSAEDAKVKTVAELLDIYYASVGRNSVLLLNVPPDRRGLIHEIDAARLRDMRRALDQTFARDLARGRPVRASQTRGGHEAYGAGRVVDGDPATYWASDDGVTSATLEIDLGEATELDRVVLQEFIRLGQRVRAFRVQVPDGEGWRQIASGKTIGYKRILRIPPVKAARVRLVIDDARASPTIATFALARSGPLEAQAAVERAAARTARRCAGALFCDDFEDGAHAPGQQPGGLWRTSIAGGSVQVDGTRAWSGGKSVRVAVGASQTGKPFRRAFISLAGAPVFPLEKNAFFGRMMFWLDAGPRGNVHFTNVQAEGPVPGRGHRAFYRYGGQFDRFVMASYDSPGASSDCWQRSTRVEMPERRWVCLEWHFDGGKDELRLWMDGFPIDELTVRKRGQGCLRDGTSGNWYAPAFDTLHLGWEHYQPSTAHEAWIDDVVLDTRRIGCPPQRP